MFYMMPVTWKRRIEVSRLFMSHTMWSLQRGGRRFIECTRSHRRIARIADFRLLGTFATVRRRSVYGKHVRTSVFFDYFWVNHRDGATMPVDGTRLFHRRRPYQPPSRGYPRSWAAKSTLRPLWRCKSYLGLNPVVTCWERCYIRLSCRIWFWLFSRGCVIAGVRVKV